VTRKIKITLAKEKQTHQGEGGRLNKGWGKGIVKMEGGSKTILCGVEGEKEEA